MCAEHNPNDATGGGGAPDDSTSKASHQEQEKSPGTEEKAPPGTSDELPPLDKKTEESLKDSGVHRGDDGRFYNADDEVIKNDSGAAATLNDILKMMDPPK
jgi:hypothetical protein